MRITLDMICALRHGERMRARYFRDIIDRYGPESEMAHFVTFRFFGAIDRNSPEEDLSVVCPVYASSVCKELAKGPAFVDRYDLRPGMLASWTEWWPKGPVFARAAAEVGEAVRKLTQEPLREKEATRFDKAWEVGPCKDLTWIKAATRLPNTQLLQHYLPYLDQLHVRFDGEHKSHPVCRLYGNFATAFFLAKRYDLAEPLLEQIVAWRDYRGRPPENAVHAQSLYLLALLRVRDRNTPAALRLTKELLEFLEKQGGELYLYDYYDLLSRQQGGRQSQSLRLRGTTLMQELREDPNPTFKDPF